MIHHMSSNAEEEPPRNRLESWLIRKLQGGALRLLPPYHPVGGRGECPEQYARNLLAGLRSASVDRRSLERLKDDGRAFRSWAERPRSAADARSVHYAPWPAC